MTFFYVSEESDIEVFVFRITIRKEKIQSTFFDWSLRRMGYARKKAE